MSKTVRRIITTIIVVLAIVALTVVMVVRTSATTRENSISHMKSIAQEQTVMIRNYVDNAKQTLNSFEAASEVNALLIDINSRYEGNQLDPKKSYTKDEVNEQILSNRGLVDAAQKYTERFSATVADPEGIWIGDWYTHCLTHTNPGTVGITTRDVNEKAEALKSLQDSMLNAPDNLYNTGIINSPATGKQILSMYKAVMYNGRPIGFVGFGIFTENLATALDSLEFNTSGTTYSMVNVKDHKYIFCENRKMVGIETEDTNMLAMCDEMAGKTADVTGSYERGGLITFYSYMADEGWMLFINTPSSEVFSFSRAINLNMILFCGVCIILIVIFNVISIKQEETVQRLEQSKRKQAAITKNLHIAALKDILTDVNNRIKFIDEFSKDDNGNCKVEDCPNSPYCFAMFNLARFSQINIQYGHDAGDAALASTADILKEHFGAQNIYRTGSDEFVAVIKSATSNTSAIIMEVNNVLAELQKPRKLGNEIISIPYAAAIVKKGVSITPAVLITLKELINNNGVSMDNNATYVDMDTF